MRWTLVVGLGAAAAYAAKRLQEVAEQEQKPLAELLSELPQRLARDAASIPDDLRMAASEGRLAAGRRVRELDEELRRAETA
jgi:hypothetical protein